MVAPVHVAAYSAMTRGSAAERRHHRRHRARRGRQERAGDAVAEGDDEERPHLGGVAERVDEQRDRSEHLTADGDERHLLAIEPVGHGAGDEHEQRRRQELAQADPAQIGGATGDVVRLLAQRRGLQRDAGEQHAVGDEQRAHAAEAQDVAGGHGGRFDGLHGRNTVAVRCYTAPMTSLADDTRWLDATDTGRTRAQRGGLSPEMIDAAIERIEAIDPALNAVVIRWFDHARELAAGELPDGPFRGVPFLLKDLWAHFAGQTLSNGCQALKDAAPVSTTDTTLVARFKKAGFVTAGRTNSPEFGSLPTTEPLAWGATRNPWNTDHSPGGSSGGSAAAVAAGMVPIAHASDGGGSIRIPASCCGLVGLKPTQGRISLGPFRDESNLGVELCVSRSVRDTAALLDAVHGPGVGDTVIAPPPTRSYLSEVGADRSSRCASACSTTTRSVPTCIPSVRSPPGTPLRPSSRWVITWSTASLRPCRTRSSPAASVPCGARTWAHRSPASRHSWVAPSGPPTSSW